MATSAKPKRPRIVEPVGPETLPDRVARLLALSGQGKMPINMVMDTEAELTEAIAYLKQRKIKHIGAVLPRRDK